MDKQNAGVYKTRGYHSALKSTLHATVWMNFEDITISQSQKYEYCLIPLVQGTPGSKFIETESRMVVIRVGGERNGEWSFDDYGGSVWENKKVLEMDGGDHWTTVEISLMLLNYTLKNGYDSTFYVNTYTHLPFGKMGRLGRKKWGEMREIQTSKGAFLMVGSSCSRWGCLPWVQQTLLELLCVKGLSH